MRIGFGYDVHRYEEDRALILCGVKIPYKLGLLGHSDADCAVHAVIDAVFGALALGDIGSHFPDTDEAYHGINSMILLDKCICIMREAGYCLGNLDVTIVAQEPKLSPHAAAMRNSLAAAFGTELDKISIKAKTEERLGFTGDLSGIKCYAVCLLEER